MIDYKKLYIEALKQWNENICDKCANKPDIICGKDCPGWEEWDELFLDGEKIKFHWTCEDIDYGDCARLENTACHGCFDENYKGFVLKEEAE